MATPLDFLIKMTLQCYNSNCVIKEDLSLIKDYESFVDDQKQLLTLVCLCCRGNECTQC